MGQLRTPAEETFTIVPLRRSRIPGRTAWISATGPKKLVAKSSWTWSSCCLLDGGAVAMAGVVDQDIDGAEALPGGAHDVTYLGMVGDIER